ncbi:MAG: polyprenol monophosphomannose synthase [Candidatus Aminicenantales bacterium]
MAQQERPPREVSVIFPTYNEKDNIAPLIQEAIKYTPQKTEIIVVDDDSPDGTWQVVENMARTQDNIYLLRRTNKKGLVSALQDGIAISRGNVIIWSDCDFSMPPEKMKDLLSSISMGYDMAVGSRFVKGGGVEVITESSDTLLAFLMSRSLNRFLQKFLDPGFKDWTSGFIAVKKNVLDQIPLKGDYGEYFIDLIYRARRLGYRIKEIPYVSTARKSGCSKTGSHFMDYISKGWKYIWLAWRLKFTKIKKG